MLNSSLALRSAWLPPALVEERALGVCLRCPKQRWACTGVEPCFPGTWELRLSTEWPVARKLVLNSLCSLLLCCPKEIQSKKNTLWSHFLYEKVNRTPCCESLQPGSRIFVKLPWLLMPLGTTAWWEQGHRALSQGCSLCFFISFTKIQSWQLPFF